MTRQLQRIEKLNRFRGATPDLRNDSYLDFVVRIRKLLDGRFSGQGQTEADGPIFVLDWLALHDDEARQYAREIEQEQ